MLWDRRRVPTMEHHPRRVSVLTHHLIHPCSSHHHAQILHFNTRPDISVRNAIIRGLNHMDHHVGLALDFLVDRLLKYISPVNHPDIVIGDSYARGIFCYSTSECTCCVSWRSSIRRSALRKL